VPDARRAFANCGEAMNYQHAFHAGNFADVHKHVVVSRILEHLRQKQAAFRVIDTHAGAGRYDLFGPEAIRSQEWRGGIGALMNIRRQQTQTAADVPGATESANSLLAPYLEIVAALNRAGELRSYPGSPLIAAALMRSQDRLIACEIEPRALARLKSALRGNANAKVLAIDGWMALNANVPPKERRGLVIVDPPYEDAADFARLSDALAQAHRKWPTGIYVLWYPVKERAEPDALAGRLRRLGIAKILRCEILTATPRADAGLVGSGLIIVNPTFKLDRELRVVLPVLGNLFSAQSEFRLDWLAQEQVMRDRAS
jgi:23S rRNA (adenine2030-N6)-methyltransferase